jgi:hypothetical protein
MEGSESRLAELIRGVGVVTALIGLAAGGYLAYKYNQPGFFGDSSFSVTEIVICSAVVYYHLVLGLLCVGVGHLIEQY